MGAAYTTEDLTMAQALVNDEIEQNNVVVFSKTTCGYCSMAKRALNEDGIKYKTIELDRRDDGGKIQNVLQVFINGKCIGGGTETQALKRRGQLKATVDAGRQ